MRVRPPPFAPNLLEAVRKRLLQFENETNTVPINSLTTLLTRTYRINKGMFYYILYDPDKPSKAKVGITKDPSVRIKSYRTAAPQCTFFKTYRSDSISRRHENRILELLSDVCRVDREYIHCNPTIISNIVESYFSDNNIKCLTTK